MAQSSVGIRWANLTTLHHRCGLLFPLQMYSAHILSHKHGQVAMKVTATIAPWWHTIMHCVLYTDFISFALPCGFQYAAIFGDLHINHLSLQFWYFSTHGSQSNVPLFQPLFPFLVFHLILLTFHCHKMEKSPIPTILGCGLSHRCLVLSIATMQVNNTNIQQHMTTNKLKGRVHTPCSKLRNWNGAAHSNPP